MWRYGSQKVMYMYLFKLFDLFCLIMLLKIRRALDVDLKKNISFSASLFSCCSNSQHILL